MKGAFRIATISGIPVQIHWSFGLILLGVFYFGHSNRMDLEGTFWVGVLALAVFTCVILHEFGHALSARRYGVNTRDITLLPIGGLARLENLPEKPFQEFVIAIAGPLVNIAIALLILIGLALFSSEGIGALQLEIIDVHAAFSGVTYLLPILFWINLGLFLFNLLPAFPMDGGRVLRSLLSMKLGRVKATRIASVLGQIVAVGFVGTAIYNGDLVLGLIGAFVFFTARQEYQMVKLDNALATHHAGEIMHKEFTRLRTTDEMEMAAATLREGKEKNLLVFDQEDRPVGVLHELFILESIKKENLSAPVLQYMSARFESIPPEIRLKEVVQKIQKHGYSILPVMSEGRLLGVIDLDLMNNFLRVQRKNG